MQFIKRLHAQSKVIMFRFQHSISLSATKSSMDTWFKVWSDQISSNSASIWNPINQFPYYFERGIFCPKRNCRKPMHICQWNIGNSISHSPRSLHGVDHTILLVAAVCSCAEGHELYSTDPHIVELFPEEEQIPFILLYHTGFTHHFACTVIHMTLEGMSLLSTEHFIHTKRLDLVGSLQLKLDSIKHYTSIPMPAKVCDCQCVKLLYKPFPSNGLLYRCFTSDFAKNKLC